VGEGARLSQKRALKDGKESIGQEMNMGDSEEACRDVAIDNCLMKTKEHHGLVMDWLGLVSSMKHG
jgi:hypothetical protein